MDKIFKQNIDWHINDLQTGKYLGEVFSFGSLDTIQIWIKNPLDVPSYLKRQIEFGFATINDDGYIVISAIDYENITEYDFV